uniref:Uncharacterized protein n=1 Tax=Aegilops tauschii subsp. strangulata TaxID=200361 RepID=A0A452ZFN1_AEGTS
MCYVLTQISVGLYTEMIMEEIKVQCKSCFSSCSVVFSCRRSANRAVHLLARLGSTSCVDQP